MERKLGSIQRILKLEPIEGADKIEKAIILGWALVVKKGEFKVNDLCVYVEVDSILPEKPEFEFLRARHFRVKTIKLRGQISQGIAFPLMYLGAVYLLSNYPDKLLVNGNYVTIEEGLDVTDILEVKKYEPYIPAQLAGTVKGPFPEFIPKTDETRIQSVPTVLERHKGKEFYVTEKVDGTSLSVYVKDSIVGVCSRNMELKEETVDGKTSAYWDLVKKLDLPVKLISLQTHVLTERSNIAIQGEMIGNGIQKNKYNLPDHQLLVFNIFDIDKQVYLDEVEMRYIAQELGLRTVPIIDKCFVLNHTVEELVEYSKGISHLYKHTQREGLVFRPLHEERDEDLGRLSFKVINPDFLLKYQDE
jgi:RNA ligase (TIGR02306 family)